MFALPFLGAITRQSHPCTMESWHDCQDIMSFDEFMKAKDYEHKNLTYIPVGGCKSWHSYNTKDGQQSGVACKQADGSWKKQK